MQNTFEREKIAEGVYFSHVTDKKFYSNRLSVHLVTPLDRETVTANAIVPFILRLGCRECPDFTALNRRLGMLYGAQLGADVSRLGARQILSVSVKGLDRRVALENEDMAGELGALLCDIVLDPLVEGDGFSAAYTALEKQNLIDAIESEINDKRVLAQERCMGLLFGDAPNAIRPYGTVEAARALSAADALSAYRALIQNAEIEVLFVGSGDHTGARDAFAKRFGALERRAPAAGSGAQGAPGGSLREKTDHMDVSQSKLVLGFRCRQEETDAYAMRMMTAMFGGTPFSKLFLNVREKLSLCYYCSSRYDRGNQVMMVSSGVERDKKQAAFDEILRQLQALQNGDFTDDELRNTLLAMNTGFDSTNDSLYALGSWYLTRILHGEVQSPSQERERMGQVTREQVVQAARSVELQAVYFLTPQDGAAVARREGEE